MRLISVLKSNNKRYIFMRGLARFLFIRRFVATIHKICNFSKIRNIEKAYELTKHASVFNDVEINSFVQRLKKDGVSFGLTLPGRVVISIMNFANITTCYADRSPKLGFDLHNHENASKTLDKKILLAQYFNTLSECDEIKELSRDPVLYTIASRYLGSSPKMVGVNLWWTFPVDASDEDKFKHAHMFHRDVDDYKFVKFFFYITDVAVNDGAHIFVKGSKINVPKNNFLDGLHIRRYCDDEVNKFYGKDNVLEIAGKAGVGFAEDTFCIHKGQTPNNKPRLLLQIQFALFDYDVMSDTRENSQFRKIV